jgi:hypothetical protein
LGWLQARLRAARALWTGAGQLFGKVARTGPVAWCGGTIAAWPAAGIKHPLAIFAAEILSRLTAGLDVGLGEFLANVGVIVLHPMPMFGDCAAICRDRR